MKKVNSKSGAMVIAKNTIATVATICLLVNGCIFGYSLVAGDYDTSGLCNSINDKDLKAICVADSNSNDLTKYNLNLLITTVSLSTAVILFYLLIDKCNKNS